MGWAVEAVPPIKGGSSIGIPSPPAVWEPMNDFAGTIDIRDAERLQGFPADWTEPAQIRARGLMHVGDLSAMLSNEISRWLAQKLINQSIMPATGTLKLKIAFEGCVGKRRTYKVNVSTWAADGADRHY